MTVITTGLSALLYMCSSGEIDRSKEIHYLIYNNTYNNGSRLFSMPPNERLFATEIANSLGYNIQFHGPYDWWCPPALKRSSTTRIHFEEPDVKAEDLNHISSNALPFLGKVLLNTQVEIFPEGASCFAGFRSLGIMPNIWVKQIRPRMAAVKKKYTDLTFYIKKVWLLPDRFGKVRSVTNGSFGFDVFNEKNLYMGYKSSSNFFIDKYSELNFSKYKNDIIFHPMLETLDIPNYNIWLRGLRDIIGNSVIFVKAKPRVQKIQLPDVLREYDCLTLKHDFNILPAELILEQFQNCRYVGYFSSMLLGFHKDLLHIKPPPDLELKKLYDKTYAGLKNILKI